MNAVQAWVTYDPKKSIKGFFDVRTTDGREYFNCWYADGSFFHARYTVRGELVTHVRRCAS